MVVRHFLICIDESDKSLSTFKWAAQYLLNAGDTVTFFHTFKAKEGVYYCR